MPDFSLKMHQIQFRLGLRSRPRWELTALPQTPSWIWGKGKGKKTGREKGKEREAEGDRGGSRERVDGIEEGRVKGGGEGG